MRRALHCVFSPLAESDLEEIGDYIARDNPRRALTSVSYTHLTLPTSDLV